MFLSNHLGLIAERIIAVIFITHTLCITNSIKILFKIILYRKCFIYYRRRILSDKFK